MEEQFNKQEHYAWQKSRLKRAMQSGFYYEAILIEYAMFEDRSDSVLTHIGKKMTNRRGNPLRLADKLNIINDDPAFQKKIIKQRLPRELIESIRRWKQKRDGLVHDLMNLPICDESAEALAQEGKELLRIFDNKVRSVNHLTERTNIEKKKTKEIPKLNNIFWQQ